MIRKVWDVAARVISGICMVMIGMSVFSATDQFEHMALKAPLVVLGICSIILGLFVLQVFYPPRPNDGD